MNQHPQHLIYEKESIYTYNQLPFSKFYKQKLKEYNENFSPELTKDSIAKQLGIPVSLMPKYIANGDKATKKRDCVIAMCMMVHMSEDDINVALSKYGMPYFDNANRRDIVIKELINKNLETVDPPLSFDELNEYLFNQTGTYFDVIEHRDGNTNNKTTYPFTVLKKRVECRTEDLINGDLYNSLDTAYSVPYMIFASMWLDDNGKKGYKLEADNYGYLSCTEYPRKSVLPHLYKSINETGVFKSCYEELHRIIKSEQKRIHDILNDTRNYHERISAKVIENELHVFYETYNYTVPELGEYYLMDYVNGEYTLYVSHESRFMRYYLSKQEYLNLFGRLSDKYDEDYSSVEQIDNAAAVSLDRVRIIRLRVWAFRNAQDKVNSLIDKLKSGQKHIRNLKYIYDCELDVLSYYKVEEDFQCSYDPEFGEINGIGNDKVSVKLPNDNQIELTFDDLCAGFSLGLNSIDEVGVFLLEHKTLKISELL